MMKDSTDENDSYLLIGNHLRSKGLPVPRILYADAGEGRFLLEDAGDLHLQVSFDLEEKTSNSSTVMSSNCWALSILRRPTGFLPGFASIQCYTILLLSMSVSLSISGNRSSMAVWGLKSLLMNCARISKLLRRLAGVDKSPFVFHRDFQSRNIMVRRARLCLLDFQGMRFGPPAYDLASLLIDPYVRLPEALQDRLAGMYWSYAGIRQGVSRADFIRKFEAVRLARNLQMLGAFGFLGVARARSGFWAIFRSPSTVEPPFVRKAEGNGSRALQSWFQQYSGTARVIEERTR